MWLVSMFKKLKQKIEEGGEGGLEKVSFSLNKFPGSVVRSTSRSVHSSSPQPPPTQEPVQLLSEPEAHVQLSEGLNWEEQNGELPSHLSSRSGHLSYQAMLEVRVKDLEQECSALNELLIKESSLHASDCLNGERKLAELDKQGTELKIQVVELELEITMKQQEHDKECQEIQNKLLKQEQLASDYHASWLNEVNQLKAVIEEKEKCIIDEENKYTALEKKAHHCESQLKAYESSSESEVVDRLHYEVADVEQRVKSRNLEIQIFERRLASQAKEHEEQIERLIDRQDGLEKTNREMMQVAKEEKMEKKRMLKELEQIHKNNVDLERERETLRTQLTVHIQAQQQLTLEYKQFQASHDKQIQELDHQIEDKDDSAKELLRQLKQLRGETTMLQPMPRLPGAARRTASIGVQTIGNFLQVEIEPIKLPESREQCASQEGNNAPAIMASLSSEDELEMMKDRQCRLEEELAEKLKIIKLQQQKIMDIKKELRLQNTFTLTDESQPKPKLKRSPSPLTPGPLRTPITSDLIRAVSTLLEFSPQEEEHVKSYLDYKMSWFGVIPPPLFTPMQTIK